MEAQGVAQTTDPGAEPVPPDDTELVELSPEHLRLLQHLAASRAARQTGPTPGAERPPGTPAQLGSGDLLQENERLRTYVAVLEAAVTLLLEPEPVNGERVRRRPGEPGTL
ncbi:hypothetical protein ACFVZ3_08950 [Kitasatospora purpeofusca]|uniref:hypothetical protein n=1 Tax=Kitasatospora purpeofusca TaxID=67352 RepID=UPI0036B3B10F